MNCKYCGAEMTVESRNRHDQWHTVTVFNCKCGKYYILDADCHPGSGSDIKEEWGDIVNIGEPVYGKDD